MTIYTQIGDLIQLRSRRGGHNFVFTLQADGRYETHKGIFNHTDLLDLPYGSEVKSHLGRSFFITKPTTAELIEGLKRNSQIMYPKDIGITLLKLGVAPGQTIIEAGTGSGGLTLALAQAVGPSGKVHSYDRRAEVQSLARKNLSQLGLDSRVEFHTQDITAGFAQTDVDALFLDVPDPWNYLAQAHAALVGGAVLGSLLPTMAQVLELLGCVHRHGFAWPETIEILLRPYKTEPAANVRPEDRMVAHTGYLTFMRAVNYPNADE